MPCSLTNGFDDFGMVFILILVFLIVLAPVFIWNVTAKILKETKQNVTATNKVAQELEALNGKMDKLLANQEQLLSHFIQPPADKKDPTSLA